MNKELFRQLAKQGAIEQLADIRSERRKIYAAFPDLARLGRMPRLKAGKKTRKAKNKKRKLTKAQRQAISKRMTRYWASKPR